jgi:predicted ATPase
MKTSNKQIVLLGRSSSGKSTLVNHLRHRGFQVCAEVPSIVLDLRKQQEVGPVEIEKRQILMYQIQELLEFSSQGQIFFDRSLVDVYAYTQYLLNDIPWCFPPKDNLSGRYNHVFDLERLPFKKTPTRIENNEKEAEEIYQFVRQYYFDLGYRPITVPAFSGESIEQAVSKRADFILSQI